MRKYILFSLVGLGIVLAHFSLAAQFQVDSGGTLTTNLNAYYELEDVTDFWSTHDMTNNGSTPFSAGKVNNAADFGTSNTTKWLHNGDELGINGGAMSISAWVNVTTQPSNQTMAFAGVFSGANDVVDILQYTDAGGAKSVQYDHDRTCVATGIISTSTTLTTGTWHHIVGTYDGTQSRLYLDGNLVAGPTNEGGNGSCNASEIGIGALNNGATYKFSGLVDEMGIWSKALSATEIADLYNGGSGQTMIDISAPTLSSPNQYKSDASTTIVEGGTTTESTVVFKGLLTSTGTNTVQLQVEVQPAGSDNFTGTPSVTSAPVSSGVQATTTYTASNGSYHWRARAIDSNNVTSTWQRFGQNTTSTDFVINVPTTTQFAVDTDGTIRTSLISYYKLEDATDSFGSNNLANNNGVSFVAGKVSNAASTTAASSEYFGTPTSMGITGGTISMSAWIYPTSQPATDTNRDIIWQASNSNAIDYDIEYRDVSGTKNIRAMRLRQGQGTDPAATYNTTLTLNTWHHVAMTYDSASKIINLWVDGVNRASSTGAGGNGTLADGDFFQIGAFNGVAAGVGQTHFWDGKIDEASIWDKVLSNQEIADLYNEGFGNTLLTQPTALGLQQYKSDATTTITKGAATTESAVVFGSKLYSTNADSVQLQVEVTTSTSFTGTPNVTSAWVASGTIAMATLDLPPESWSNGNYHWRARVIASSTGATSTWQLFGPTATSTDFKINNVPLYTQTYSQYPSYASTTDWHNNLYAGSSTIDCGQGAGVTSTIGYCGCAITSVVMWLRYFGITTDGQGNDVNPGNLNAWLTNHSGYDVNGNFKWDRITDYASSTSGLIIYDANSTSYGSSASALRPYVDSNLSSTTPNPVIIRESANDHFVVATGFAQNAGTSTYTTRDTVWYLTKYLNQTSSTDIYGYNNAMDGIRVYYDPLEAPPVSEYHVNSPNTIMLVDSQGRRTGKDPSTGIFYREIPGTSYGEDGLSPTNRVGELFVSGVQDGQYTLYVLGGKTGPYWVDLGINDRQHPHKDQIIRGDIQAGSMIAYTQIYDSTNLANSTLTFQQIISSTEIITSASPHNLPPPPVSVPVTSSSPPSPLFYSVAPLAPTTSTLNNSSSTTFSPMQITTSSAPSTTATTQ